MKAPPASRGSYVLLSGHLLAAAEVHGTGKSLDSLNSMQDGTMNLSRRKQMT